MIQNPRPLEYWISPQLSQAGHGSASVLRRMALNDAQSRATYLMMYFWSAWLLVIGVVLAFLAPAVILYAAVPGLVLAPFAVLLHLRRRGRAVPSQRFPASSRAPSTIRGAWTGVALVAVGTSAIVMVSVLSGSADLSARSVTGGVLAVMFLVALFIGTLVIPAWHIENSARLFREQIGTDARLRQELEALAQTYTDPSGRLPFGPL
ncbi:hypothetical protein GCM10027403_20960 [Arthrobacter tecti]